MPMINVHNISQYAWIIYDHIIFVCLWTYVNTWRAPQIAKLVLGERHGEWQTYIFFIPGVNLKQLNQQIGALAYISYRHLGMSENGVYPQW